MAALVALEPGDVLVLRRADSTEPSDEEQARLQLLIDDLGIAGVLVLGVDDAMPNILRYTDEQLAELGLQRVAEPIVIIDEPLHAADWETAPGETTGAPRVGGLNS